MCRGDLAISCLTWNVHSLNNKCDDVMGHIMDKKADIVFLTETWQKSSHNNVTATIKRYGYTPYHKIREHGEKSRGVVLEYCAVISMKLKLNILKFRSRSHWNFVCTP